MNIYQSFAHSVTGISHTKQGKACQDAIFKHYSENLAIAVVADGHGDDNCFRSDRGAKFAAECAARGLKSFAAYINDSQENPQAALRERLIEQGIIPAWYGLVAQDFAKFPLTAQDIQNTGEKYRRQYMAGENLHHAYGTTLIAAAITKDFWFAIHIGDGRLSALYPDGSFDQPVPWDEKCFLNVTTSICDPDAAERARCYFSFHREKPPPAAVFLCTDGIDDNYPVEGNEKHLYKLYRAVALTFAEDGFEKTCDQLEKLAGRFANEGKGDDTSIAGFVDMQAVKKAAEIWQKEVAAEEQAAQAATQVAAPAAAGAETQAAAQAAAQAEAQAAIEAYGKTAKPEAAPPEKPAPDKPEEQAGGSKPGLIAKVFGGILALFKSGK
ncbi:MAG: protein phosphatase 2C domain-containing protein [Spirochaetes bacterium]|nr:protein phosphatase 2C domain-containing protein [Spirochaetota bacterium]